MYYHKLFFWLSIFSVLLITNDKIQLVQSKLNVTRTYKLIVLLNFLNQKAVQNLENFKI